MIVADTDLSKGAYRDFALSQSSLRALDVEAEFGKEISNHMFLSIKAAGPASNPVMPTMSDLLCYL